MNPLHMLQDYDRTKTHLVLMRMFYRMGVAELENAKLLMEIFQRDGKHMPKPIRKQFFETVAMTASKAHDYLWLARAGGYNVSLDPHLED